MDQLRMSTERVMSSTGSQRRYERHRSATSLKSKEDPLLKCIELDYTDELDNILKTRGKHYTQEYLDKALFRAAQLGKSECCQALVNAGADPNAFEDCKDHKQRHEAGRCPFTQDHGKQESWLKSHSSVGGTPLHMAVENGRLHTTQILIHLGSPVNAQDRNGVTALMLACMKRGTSNLVHLITLTPGCDMKIQDYVTGKSVLHYAAEVGDAANMKLLLEAGANVDDRDKNGNSPLMLTVSPFLNYNPRWPTRDTGECVKILMEYNCFVNTFNKDQKSPIHAAVESQSEEAVVILLQKSALVTDDIIRMATLEVRNAVILEKLLSGGHSFTDEYLCGLLLVVISSVTSKWSFNAAEQERNIHELAKVLIKNICDRESFTNIAQRSDDQLQAIFGEMFLEAMSVDDLNELRMYGMFGYAIIKEKYSIARMLVEAGCMDNISRLKGKTQLWQHAMQHPYLKTWLPTVLNSAVQAPCNNIDGHEDTLTIADMDMNKAFDNIEPYDNVIHSAGQGMLDLNYRSRENSKAYLATNVLIYNDVN